MSIVVGLRRLKLTRFRNGKGTALFGSIAACRTAKGAERGGGAVLATTWRV